MPETHELHIKPQGQVLTEFWQSNKRWQFIRGPLGSGKTIQTILKVLKLMCEQEANKEGIRPSRWWAVRNTYADLQETTIKDWLAICGDYGKFVNAQPPYQKLDFDLPDGTTVKAEIIFRALDRPDTIKKLRGSQVTGFWLNETKELDKAILDMADARHGRYPSLVAGGTYPTWHGIIGDYNSPDEDHYLYKMAEEDSLDIQIKIKRTNRGGYDMVNLRDTADFFHQPGGLIKTLNRHANGQPIYELNEEAENLLNLPSGYYETTQIGKSEEWIDVNLCNEYGFVSDGKPVHPQYVDSVHCSSVDLVADKKLPLELGFDFGRTPACSIGQYDRNNGRILIIDEFLASNLGAPQFAKELNKYLAANYPDFKVNRGWGDPSGDSKGQATDDTPFKILNKAGLFASPTFTNDPLIRRSAISNPCLENAIDGRPRFLISPKAKMTRKGLMGGFCFKRVQVTGEKYRDEPDKNEYSHVVEACEYLCLGLGEGRKAITSETYTAPVQIQSEWSPF